MSSDQGPMFPASEPSTNHDGLVVDYLYGKLEDQDRSRLSAALARSPDLSLEIKGHSAIRTLCAQWPDVALPAAIRTRLLDAAEAHCRAHTSTSLEGAEPRSVD